MLTACACKGYPVQHQPSLLGAAASESHEAVRGAAGGAAQSMEEFIAEQAVAGDVSNKLQSTNGK